MFKQISDKAKGNCTATKWDYSLAQARAWALSWMETVWSQGQPGAQCNPGDTISVQAVFVSLISSNLIKTSPPRLRQSHAEASGYYKGAAYLAENKWKLIQRAQCLGDKAGEAL